MMLSEHDSVVYNTFFSNQSTPARLVAMAPL